MAKVEKSTYHDQVTVISHQHADYPTAADLAIRIARLSSTK